MPDKKQKTELYLKVPYKILNISGISLAEKLLLAHIYSFGAKGCWQSNKTLAEMFMVSVASIKRWLSSLGKYISVKNPKGYYRTIWAKSHPEVKKSVSRWVKNEPHVAQKCASDRVKNELPLARKCATTNNKTIKENYKRNTATPSPPLPKGAPALLSQRGEDADEKIQHFVKNFGREKKKFKPMPEEQFQKRKQAQMKALLGEKN